MICTDKYIYTKQTIIQFFFLSIFLLSSLAFSFLLLFSLPVWCCKSVTVNNNGKVRRLAKAQSSHQSIEWANLWACLLLFDVYLLLRFYFFFFCCLLFLFFFPFTVSSRLPLSDSLECLNNLNHSQVECKHELRSEKKNICVWNAVEI